MYVFSCGLNAVAAKKKEKKKPVHLYSTSEKKMGGSDAERKAWRKKQSNIRLQGAGELIKST